MIEADEALVIRSQQGDRSAFEELVRRTGRLVYARIFLETADAHRTEDLTQETFLLAYRKIRQVSDPRGFRGWLLSIANSAVVDAARRDSRKKRAGTRVDSAVMMRLADGGPAPPEALENAEAREKALALLRKLPEEYRLPLILRYIGGADYETIGRQLALTNGSLRGLLHRGLEMLRAGMKESPELRVPSSELSRRV